MAVSVSRAEPSAARVLRGVTACVFLGGGLAKLVGLTVMVALFDDIGLGQWLRYVTGLTEVIGGGLLLVPALAPFGVLLLLGVMLGAVAAEVLIRHRVPVLALTFLGALLALASKQEMRAALRRRR